MRFRKLKQIIGYSISIIPFNILRCFFYKNLLGYKIKNSKIGWMTVIVVENVNLINCSISRNNKFIGPMKVLIKSGASIGPKNTFQCGWWCADHKYISSEYDRKLHIEENTLITTQHFIDTTGSFTLGEDSWISGSGSQFWTHGAGAKDRNIRIGKNCYIGSAVKFSPGANIGNNCIVGLGSIVVKKEPKINSIIAGNPAKVIRKNYNWKTRTDFEL